MLPYLPNKVVSLFWILQLRVKVGAVSVIQLLVSLSDQITTDFSGLACFM